MEFEVELYSSMGSLPLTSAQDEWTKTNATVVTRPYKSSSPHIKSHFTFNNYISRIHLATPIMLTIHPICP